MESVWHIDLHLPSQLVARHRSYRLKACHECQEGSLDRGEEAYRYCITSTVERGLLGADIKGKISTPTETLDCFTLRNRLTINA